MWAVRFGRSALSRGTRCFSQTPPSPPTMRPLQPTFLAKFAKGFAVTGAVTVAGFCTASYAKGYDLQTSFSLLRRQARVGWAVTKMTVAYQYTLWKIKSVSDLEADRILSETHLYAAQVLLDMCLQNKGVFIKLGQYIACQTLLLPPEYTDTLSQLQDRVPPRPWSEIKQTLEKEFGSDYMKTKFSYINEEAVAAGSLAQVHRGQTTDGRDVAIKIQYDDVRQTFDLDMYMIESFVHGSAEKFPDFNFQWLLNEFESDVPQEIDFINEGKNGEKLADLFSKDSRLKVPEIIWPCTTTRVLTMEFIGGDVCKLTDREGILKLGFSEADVCSILADTFCIQAFRHGFVHADPHPGNILVRRNPASPKKPQLVLLDHGLYREMDEEFRTDYCTLWKSLILQDEETALKMCEKFGVLKYYKLFTVVVTGRDYDKSMKGGFHSQFTIEDQRRLQAEVNKQSKEILSILSNVPQKLILVLKINNYLASLDVGLGTPVNTFYFILSHCVREVSTYRTKYYPWHRAWYENARDYFGIVRAICIWVATSIWGRELFM